MTLVTSLARAYVACAPGLPSVDDGLAARISAHGSDFRKRLPLRMRVALGAVLGLFATWTFLHGFRRYSGRPVDAQARLYERFVSGRGYVRSLLAQLLHLAFLGSLYAQP